MHKKKNAERRMEKERGERYGEKEKGEGGMEAKTERRERKEGGIGNWRLEGAKKRTTKYDRE